MMKSSLNGLYDSIWKSLAAATERGSVHEWRRPVLATVDHDGAADARVVVLRGANVENGTLRVFTDRRSPKVKQINAAPKGTLCFYSDATKTQLRAHVELRIVDDVREEWKLVKCTPGARDYMTAIAPGEDLIESTPQTSLEEEHVHFCVIEAHVVSLDWLELRADGHHKRAHFSDAGRSSKWIVP